MIYVIKTDVWEIEASSMENGQMDKLENEWRIYDNW